MFRYQILIEYEGTNFRGWQVQKKGKTVQGLLQNIISNQMEVACNKNQSIKILEIQRQGKRPQKISEFMLGSQIKKGSKLLNV